MNPDLLTNAQYGLLFDIRRSIRYHDRRQSHFERLHRCTSVLTILLAGSILFELGKQGQTSIWLNCLSVAAALLSAIDMVVGYSNHANLHRELKMRFNELECEIIEGGNSDGEWARYQHKRLVIERSEPPVYRALDALCHNELAAAEGHDKEQIRSIGWLKRWTCQFFHWSDIAHT